jgi:tRNA U34 2-thiouridine synthase MnmA/TrmU
MPKTSPTKAIPVLFVLCIFVLVSCTPKTEEDQIRDLMKEAGQHIEKKKLSQLMDYLSDDYSDFRGRDKSQTQDMVETYFSEFRGIVVHVLSTRIDGIDLGAATVQTDAALSSGKATVLRKLVPVSTDNYRFKIELIKKQDRWQIRYAEWKHIGVEE